MIVFGEAQLRRILTKYAAYYNELRTHQSLAKDAPHLSRYPARRLHRIGAGRRWPSPPLLSNLVFGTDSWRSRESAEQCLFRQKDFQKVTTPAGRSTPTNRSVGLTSLATSHRCAPCSQRTPSAALLRRDRHVGDELRQPLLPALNVLPVEFSNSASGNECVDGRFISVSARPSAEGILRSGRSAGCDRGRNSAVGTAHRRHRLANISRR